MSEEPRRSHRPFDMEEWLESVEGKTIRLDAPDGFPELPACYYMPPWARPHEEFWCSECDQMRFPVFDDRETASRHCPVCGNEPGALELGTDGTLAEVEENGL